MFRLSISIIALMFVTSCQNKEKADLILVNGNIYTLDDSMHVAESMVIRDGKVLAVGNSTDILNQFDAKEVVDLDRKSVYPGFIDAHCHFFGLGEGLIRWAELRNTTSMSDVLKRLKQFTTQNPQEWILGRGWDQNDWVKKDFPDCNSLDKAFPETPVALVRIDGHAMLVNSAAMRKAGITADTQVEGGEILLKNNKPTGILIDNAMQLVKDIIPKFPLSLVPMALEAAEKKCFSYGLTMVADAGLDAVIVENIDSLQLNGLLKIRMDAWLNPTQENLDKYITKDVYQTEKLRIGAIKLYADGALGSRGALLKKPYSDAAKTTGLEVDKLDKLIHWAKIAYDNGYQINVHAIGDSGVENVIIAYATFLKSGNDRRWRIEHAQIVDSSEMKLFGKYSIIPSVQPTHATSDMYWAEHRLGNNRIKNSYAYAELLVQNNWMPLGTDFPIEEVNPILTFYAAVVRKDLKNFPSNGFQTENALTREQALRGMTIWASKASFMEKINGSLEKGKVADFVILSGDLMTVKEKDIPRIKVLATFIDGQKVYPSESSR